MTTAERLRTAPAQLEPEPDPPATAGAQRPAMSRALTLLFAVAAGAAVGNLYWAQPLLHMLGRDLSVSSATAGLLVTLTQVGYAVGVLLLVPLGDVRDRRGLITTRADPPAAGSVVVLRAPPQVPAKRGFA